MLVAGPVFQAVLELRDEDIERDRIAAAADEVGRPKRLSPWWWLLPPAAYLISKRRQDAFQRALVTQLSDEDLSALVSFLNKAAGWLIVGTGGLLIAATETWDLVERHEWEPWLFWLIMVVMAALCVGHASVRSARERKIAATRRSSA